MSYGMEVIKNSADKIVIDGANINLEIVHQGSVAATTTNYYGTYFHYYFIDIPTIYADDTLLFVQMNAADYNYSSAYTGKLPYWQQRRIGNKVLVKAPFNIIDMYSSSPPRPTVNYFIAKSVTTSDAGGGYGAAVYNEDGNVVYSSNRSYVRVKTYGKLLEENTKLTDGTVDWTNDYLTNTEMFSPALAFCGTAIWPNLGLVENIDPDPTPRMTAWGNGNARTSMPPVTQWNPYGYWGPATYYGGNASSNLQSYYIIAGAP